MLATLARDLPAGGEWTFEPKYDGIRAIAVVTAGAVVLLTRNGNDKAHQFPELLAALRELRERHGADLVLDGEIVALRAGQVVRFEALAGRMHTENPRSIARLSREQPAAYVAYDLLLTGRDPLVPRPWAERRASLERVLDGRETDRVRLGATSPDGGAMMEDARREQWEGVVAKRTGARYQPGIRSRDWLKVKLAPQEEFVIGGWTDPTHPARKLGAVLLGRYGGDGRLRYVGHTGKGFSERMLRSLHARLQQLERSTSPFDPKPRLVQAHHWADPVLVAEIRYSEWTAAGKLRDSTFLGLRDDKAGADLLRDATEGADDGGLGRIEAALREIEEGEGSGTIEVDGAMLDVAGLARPAYPGSRFTRGDLLRYYVKMSPCVLPVLRDRPLAVAYFPGSPSKRPIYRQGAPPDTPDGVRVDEVQVGRERKRMLVGGDLATLLFTIARGAVSHDPWHARVPGVDEQDYVVLDLDPMPAASFSRVVEVARVAGEVVRDAGLESRLKTSGRSGLHVYALLPPGTTVRAAGVVAERLAREVTRRAPGLATVERSTTARPRDGVYVDHLMSRRGANVAGAYAVRATPELTVSAPLAWSELSDVLDPLDFTVETMPARLRAVGDLWSQSALG
ncbi:MAG TPA: DNA ligase D [Longimicrobium sp.]|jgi:bifunctional non-homologous end joining protein LigD|uniref:DNA ligase D n=1 Tax=Longimicrobium sp. TaxID=2029185 RepID=UPI002ED98499